MKLTIHRGSNVIGGSCIELQSASSKILLDFGMPLVDSNKNPFDSDTVKKSSFEQLIKERTLPDLKGVNGGVKVYHLAEQKCTTGYLYSQDRPGCQDTILPFDLILSG